MIIYLPPAMNSIRDAIVIAKRKAIEANDIVCAKINDVDVYVSKDSNIDECLMKFHKDLAILHNKQKSR